MNTPAQSHSLIHKYCGTGLRQGVLAFAIPAALAVQFLLAGAAHAQTIWNNAGTGSWFDQGNWSPAAVPTAADDVQIDNGGTAQILSGSAVSADAYLGSTVGSMGTVLVSGSGATWTNSSAFLIVGDLGTGLLTIQNGATVSNDFGFIGFNSLSNGTVLVSGAGSTWISLSGIEVGNAGTGMLTIQNGATVSSATLNSDVAYIGINNGSHGTVLVSGPGSNWSNNGDIAIGDDGTGQLTVQNGGAVNVGGGTGNVALGSNSGTGTLNIGAFGGGTTAGTVEAGSISGDLGTAVINFNQTDTITFTPQITGSIVVNQLGSGVTILPGANSYTGGTTVSAGTLRSLDPGALGTGTVTLNGGNLNPVGALTASELDWGGGRVALANPSSDGGATGDILNASILSKQPGGGTYALGQVSQNVTYTLTTFTTNSGFSVTDFSAQGTTPGVTFQGVFTLNPGDVEFTITGASVTLGNGSLLQNSAPVYIPTFADVTLTGSVSTGGPGESNIVKTLTFSPGSSLTVFNRLYITTGQVNVVGGSSIDLEQALLSASQLNVLLGGFLGGSGTVQGGLYLAGTLSPGHSPGQIHVTGNYTQASTGLLKIEIGGRELSQHDLLSVGGAAQLGGILQLVRLNNFKVKRDEPVTFLTTGGGIVGKFAVIDNGFSSDTILEPTVIYGSNSVSLEAVQGSFGKFADREGLTRNQKSVARALDSVAFRNAPPKVIDYLDNRTLDKLPGDFDKIAPEELTSIFTIGTSLATVQSQNIQRRTDDIRSGSSGFSAAGLAINGAGPSYSGSFGLRTGVAGPTGDDGKDVKEGEPIANFEDPRFGAFLSGTGEWVSVGNTDNARGYDLESGGFTLGIDYKVTPNFAIGLAAGYTGTTAELADRGRIWVNGGKIGLYGTFFQNEQAAAAPMMSKDSSKDSSKEAPAPAPSIAKGFYADVAVFGGYNSYDTRRSALQGKARGDTDGGEFNALFGTGYDFKAGGLTFGPTASFNYTYLGTNGFTEQGSLAPLDIHGGKGESLRTALGFKASYDWKIGSILLKPEIRAAWQHEFGDSAFALDSNFGNGRGNSFFVNGPQLGRDSALLGAGFAIQCSERFSTYFYYDGELGRKNYESNSVTGGVRMAF